MINKEKMNALMIDKEFVNKVIAMSPEDACKAFNEAGVEVSLDEVNKAGELINQILSNGNEFDEKTLENITGGGAFGDFVKGAAIGVTVTVIGAGIGMICGW